MTLPEVKKQRATEQARIAGRYTFSCAACEAVHVSNFLFWGNEPPPPPVPPSWWRIIGRDLYCPKHVMVLRVDGIEHEI